MKVRCPTCGATVEFSPQNPFRPFCSEQCRTIDLGAWANDEYVIPGEIGSAMNLTPEDLEAAIEASKRLEEKRKNKKKR